MQRGFKSCLFAFRAVFAFGRANEEEQHKQQQAARITANHIICTTKHVLVTATRGKDLRIWGPIKHKIRQQWLCISGCNL